MILGREGVKVARTSEGFAKGCLVALWGMGWRSYSFTPQSSLEIDWTSPNKLVVSLPLAQTDNLSGVKFGFIPSQNNNNNKVWNNAWLKHSLLAVGRKGVVLTVAILESSLGSSHREHIGLSHEPQPPGACGVNLLATHNPI